MNRRRLCGSTLLVLVALVIAACGPPATAESRAVNGRRVQGTSVAAMGEVPYRISAYEIVFTPVSGAETHAQRAALLVDLSGDHGMARGFFEWGLPGEVPLTYVAGGWARERHVGNLRTTVFELALDALEPRDRRREPASPRGPTPLAVRLVVDETSGDVTLTRRR